MAPKRNCTQEQHEFLLSHFPRYVQIPKSKSSQFNMFWKTVEGEFFSKFPERASLVQDNRLPPEDAEIQLPKAEEDVILQQAIVRRKKVSRVLVLR